MKSKNSKVCEWALAADERVKFTMFMDELGNISCIKNIGYYEISEDLAIKLGNSLAIAVCGIIRELSTLYGPFKYAMVKHNNTVIVGLKIKDGYLIFSAKDDSTPEIVQRVKEAINLYMKK